MVEVKERIEAAKVNLEKAKQAKTRAETNLETATKQKEEVVQKMTAEGVTPETIEAEITNLEAGIADDLTKVEGLIPIL